jgi:hypothetical protein
MSVPQLKNDTIKVRQLIEDYRAGHIVIPEFQREYVWNKAKRQSLSSRFTVLSPYRLYCCGRAQSTLGLGGTIRGRRVQRP